MAISMHDRFSVLAAPIAKDHGADKHSKVPGRMNGVEFLFAAPLVPAGYIISGS